jgi:hypothetical protein
MTAPDARADATDVVFDRVGDHRLYALSSRGQAGVPGYWAGYWPAAAAPAPPVLTLEEAWSDAGGLYLFCGLDPTADPGTFLDALEKVYSADTRMLWIEDPTVPAAMWILYRLVATPEGSGRDAAWRLTRQARFPLGGYSVEIDRGTLLKQADPASIGVGIAGTALVFAAPGEAYPASPGSVVLPLAGPALGAWSARLDFPRGGTEGPDDLARLGVELRYALVDPGDPQGTAVRSVPMEILRQDGAALAGHLVFDPLRPLSPERTAIGLLPPGDVPAPGSGVVAAGPVLGTGLRTVLGHPVQLSPAQADPPMWPARFAFCYSPLFAGAPADYRQYYLAPDGAFALTSPPQPGGRPDRRLLLGLSGGEYAELAADGSASVLFQSGRPAFASGARPAQAPPAPQAEASLLDDSATTAYLTIMPSSPGTAGLTYYAEPQQSSWYGASTAASAGDEPGFLQSLPLPAASLPALPGPPDGVPRAVPVGVYAGLAPEAAGAARVLEDSALAPARRAAIGVVEGERLLGAGDSAGSVRVVTAQGLVADVLAGSTPRETAWQRVIIASFPGAAVPELAITGIKARLRAALQSRELFFVAADAGKFMDGASVRYRLDALALELLAAQQVPPQVIDQLRTLVGLVFETEEEFDRALPADALPYQDEIREVAGLLKAEVEDWTFQLSPRSWRTDLNSPTVMLVKYSDRTLAELVAEPGAWGWPEAAGDIAATRTILQDMFEAAAAAPDGSPHRRFFAEVVDDPAWNGVLFLNAPVSAAELPDDLQFVTAGIDPGQFYAHHMGFSLTPVQAPDGQIVLGRTAAFGLLHYEDPADQVFGSTVPFAFKTQQLSVRFAAGAVADMSAQVQLLVNRLFGDVLAMDAPEHGNNLVLSGAYQRNNGVPSYHFTLTRRALFSTARSVLSSVEVTAVALQTAAGSVVSGTVDVDFVLSGTLRFAELPVFDLFSYGPQLAAPAGQEPEDGYLRYSGLAVRMRFPTVDPRRQTFSVDEGRMAFDPGSSRARPGSLAAGFPVQVNALVAVSADTAADGEESGAGQRPADLGYTTILAPLDQSPLKPPWYGLAMSMDLGTLGALAGGIGLSTTLLAAWAPGAFDDERPVYFGLRTEGGLLSGKGLAVQGVLKFGFRSVEFLAVEDSGRREYLMRLNRLALSVLGWSLPPGDLSVVVFGAPEAQRASALGWYAAYSDPKKPPAPAGIAQGALSRQSPPAVLRRLRAGRRELPPNSGLRHERRR